MIEEIQKIIAAEQEEIRRRYKAELKMRRLLHCCSCSLYAVVLPPL